MMKAECRDKPLVVDILSRSFDDNQSLNYVLKQDGRRKERLNKLMAYCFDVCSLFGDVYLSEDQRGCTLLVFPERKKTTLQSLLLDRNS